MRLNEVLALRLRQILKLKPRSSKNDSLQCIEYGTLQNLEENSKINKRMSQLDRKIF